ncbi:hypothetical protein RUM44_008700 [Polyplax serrata]|uniref:Cyclin N-terminal domain-containing protein n=1 Tax=Polyplax serrata TaxID=468196 RepID=A0ABR1B8Z8_POLSC
MAAENKHRFAFYTPKLIKATFNICKLLKQPPDVRYLAIDIVDRFLTCHFLEVADTYRAVKKANESDWMNIVEKMLKQSLLRILTCIQIAIKFCSNCSTITVKTVQDVLSYLKHSYKYSKRNIIKSEVRIYKTLKCNIPSTTPFVYVEMLFEDFQRQIFHQHSRPSLSSFFKTCICVLDIALVNHRKIYDNLQVYSKENKKADMYSNRSNSHEEDEAILRTSKGEFIFYIRLTFTTVSVQPSI